MSGFVVGFSQHNNPESTPKSKKIRHCEARSNLRILVICILRLLHFVRNGEKLLFGVDSIFTNF